MSSSPYAAPLGLVAEEPAPVEVDEVYQQMAASEEDIASLESELKEAATREAETASQLDTDRQRTAAAERQLREAREKAARLMLDEANRTRSAILAEADELLNRARSQAENEAGQLTKQAFDEAKEMLAEARRDSEALVDASRDKAKTLEADAARRLADLDTKHRQLTEKLSAMDRLSNELRETLELVADSSTNEPAQTQGSLKQVHPGTGTFRKRHSDLTRSETATGETSPEGIAATSPADDDEAASLEASQSAEVGH